MKKSILPKSTLQICAICKWLTVTGGILLLIQMVVGNGLNSIIQTHWNMLAPEIQENTTYTSTKKSIVYVVAALGYLGAFLWAGGIFRIFYSLEKFNPFSRQISNALKFLGTMLILSAIISIALTTLLCLAMTYGNPPDMGVFTIRFSSGEVSLLLLGIAIRIVGRIMLQAAVIDEENRQFV